MTKRAAMACCAALALAQGLFWLAPLAMPPSYSWLRLGTSESAAQLVEGAWVARLGFVSFGFAVLGSCWLCRRAWGPLPTALHVGFGASMILVAVFSHAPWEPGVAYSVTEDRLHSLFATVAGFSFIAGVVAGIWARRTRTVAAFVADVLAIGVAAVVPLFMSSDYWGVLQRGMFLVAAGWYAWQALVADKNGVSL